MRLSHEEGDRRGIRKIVVPKRDMPSDIFRLRTVHCSMQKKEVGNGEAVPLVRTGTELTPLGVIPVQIRELSNCFTSNEAPRQCSEIGRYMHGTHATLLRLAYQHCWEAHVFLVGYTSDKDGRRKGHDSPQKA